MHTRLALPSCRLQCLCQRLLPTLHLPDQHSCPSDTDWQPLQILAELQIRGLQLSYPKTIACGLLTMPFSLSTPEADKARVRQCIVTSSRVLKRFIPLPFDPFSDPSAA